MKLNRYLPVIFSLVPTVMLAQGAVDVFKMSQNELRGTARFMSMGGAFGALGGDITTLGQNPAGIGVYRSSDIGVTVDFDAQSTKAMSSYNSATSNQLKVNCNNVGYVGAMRLDSEIMPNINWGISYSRPMSFNRHYLGNTSPLKSSMTNCVADYTNAEGWKKTDLGYGTNGKYNPYYDSNAPWMSILAYNTYLINPENNGAFTGLFKSGSTGIGEFEVDETGGVNEFNLNFGGNIANIVYWGLGFGITDLDYRTRIYYGEAIKNGTIAEFVNQKATGRNIDGDAAYGLTSDLHTSGSGWNFKMGVIVKPVNELRLGFAFHTPTYYSLKDEAKSYVGADFTPSTTDADRFSIDDYTEVGEVWYKIRTPWRYITSVAAVIGGKGILSFDYERQDYNGIEYRSDADVLDVATKANIKTYYKAIDIFRVGAEYRVTNRFSVRAGYSYQTSPVKDYAYDGNVEVYTSSTTPAYTFDKSTQYITCGLGYRYNCFYADLAYIHKSRKSIYNAFPQGAGLEAPSAKLTDNNNRIAVTLGVRF